MILIRYLKYYIAKAKTLVFRVILEDSQPPTVFRFLVKRLRLTMTRFLTPAKENLLQGTCQGLIHCLPLESPLAKESPQPRNCFNLRL